MEEFEDEALGVEQCLFCSHISDSLDTNVAHMTTAHSFFIPDVEYLIDLEGLISYLGEFACMIGTMPDFTHAYADLNLWQV